MGGEGLGEGDVHVTEGLGEGDVHVTEGLGEGDVPCVGRMSPLRWFRFRQPANWHRGEFENKITARIRAK